MDPLQEARGYAMQVPPGSPVFHAAVGVCAIRGLQPNMVQLSAGLLNWQAIVAEQYLLELMAREFRR